MASRIRILLLALGALAVVLAISTHRSAATVPTPGVAGATPAELRDTMWALTIYADAGLDLPDLRFAFHETDEGCGGNRAFYQRATGLVDLCTRNEGELERRHVLLHELAHAYTFETMDGAERAAFVERHGLESWNDRNGGWHRRGAERAANIVAWGVTPRPEAADWMDPESCLAYADDYERITGRAPTGEALESCNPERSGHVVQDCAC